MKYYTDEAGTNEIAKDDIVIPAKGHTRITIKGYPASCEYAGKTDGAKCSTCNLLLESQQTIPKKGHAAVTDPAAAATKETDGKTQGSHCSVCNKVLEEQKRVPRVETIVLSENLFTYNQEYQSPLLIIKDADGNKLSKGTDYTVSGLTGRKSVGTYNVTVNLCGKYSGKETLYFSIQPKSPTNVKAKLYGYDDVKVSWNKTTGADGYYVCYKEQNAEAYVKYKRTTKTYRKISSLKDGVKYEFQVIPYFAEGGERIKSSKYGKASIYTLKKLDAPTVKKSGTKVKVGWKNIPGESGYQISKSTKKTGTKIVATVKGTLVKTKQINAAKGKTYYYKVRAYKTVDGKKIFGTWSDVTRYKRK